MVPVFGCDSENILHPLMEYFCTQSLLVYCLRTGVGPYNQETGKPPRITGKENDFDRTKGRHWMRKVRPRDFVFWVLRQRVTVSLSRVGHWLLHGSGWMSVPGRSLSPVKTQNGTIVYVTLDTDPKDPCGRGWGRGGVKKTSLEIKIKILYVN